MTEQRKTGTYEWAEKTVNCCTGCSHSCRYCYARYNAVNRYHRVKLEDWATERVRPHDVKRKHPKYPGVVMFPSTHDITPGNLDACLTVLRHLVEAGNQVLVVSKPHYPCIDAILGQLWDAREQIEFRFTIGALSPDMLRFWEPGAPGPEERLRCLRLAFDSGWRTSVSAEPLLDPASVGELYQAVLPWLTGDFWVGKLNHAEERVNVETIEERNALAAILHRQTDNVVMAIVRALDGMPHVRWKDSYIAVMKRVVWNGKT